MQMGKRYSKALLFILALVVAAIFWRQPYLTFGLEAAIGIGLLHVSGWMYWKYYALCALLGAASEVVVIYHGAWSYALPQLLGIPIWLPLIWGTASLFFISLAPHVAGKPRER